jgi:hypothetical protein
LSPIVGDKVSICAACDDEEMRARRYNRCVPRTLGSDRDDMHAASVPTDTVDCTTRTVCCGHAGANRSDKPAHVPRPKKGTGKRKELRMYHVTDLQNSSLAPALQSTSNKNIRAVPQRTVAGGQTGRNRRQLKL